MTRFSLMIIIIVVIKTTSLFLCRFSFGTNKTNKCKNDFTWQRMLRAKWLRSNRTYIPDADECQDSILYKMYMCACNKCWNLYVTVMLKYVRISRESTKRRKLIASLQFHGDVCMLWRWLLISLPISYVCDYCPLCKLLSIFWSTSLVPMLLFYAIVFCLYVFVWVCAVCTYVRYEYMRALNPTTTKHNITTEYKDGNTDSNLNITTHWHGIERVLIVWMFWYRFTIIIMLRVTIKALNSLNSCEREVFRFLLNRC